MIFAAKVTTSECEGCLTCAVLILIYKCSMWVGWLINFKALLTCALHSPTCADWTLTEAVLRVVGLLIVEIGTAMTIAG